MENVPNDILKIIISYANSPHTLAVCRRWRAIALSANIGKITHNGKIIDKFFHIPLYEDTLIVWYGDEYDVRMKKTSTEDYDVYVRFDGWYFRLDDENCADEYLRVICIAFKSNEFYYYTKSWNDKFAGYAIPIAKKAIALLRGLTGKKIFIGASLTDGSKRLLEAAAQSINKRANMLTPVTINTNNEI